ncbi:AraC family transcriptional regulator [Parasphingopyxis marina]|uniref:AraC family transcriptional regulator n=1 Tax=Parasphingopyxis marina TaxID=2761622 RepID=A0A842I295_9SPHN|nr:AraC family transcriptional regulator [Parasphingopyxis marina]MBC2778951.1 AraC family transcriptional regulator [Parasphingopyxis marina]
MLLDPTIDYEHSIQGRICGKALESWKNFLSASVMEMDIVSLDADQFGAKMRHFGLGQISLNQFYSTPQRVVRSHSMARRSSQATYELVFVLEKPAYFQHCGRELKVPEGNFVLLDNSEAFELRFDEGSQCLSTHIEDRWLRRWIAHPKAIVASPFDGTQSWGATLASLLQAVSSRGLVDAPLSRNVIGDQIGATLALMAGNGGQPASRHQEELFSRLMNILRDRFDDTELSPAKAARLAGISKRHLHGVFASNHTTYGAELMAIRLSHAAMMLKDKRYAAYRMADIAWSSGFSDPSHFARRFREGCGQSPTDYRKYGAP